MRHEKNSMHSGKHHAARHEAHMKAHELHSGHMKKDSHHKIEVHHDGHRHEYHHDNDMHREVHEIGHGHRRRGYNEMMEHGGLPREEMYYGIKGGSMNERRGMGDIERARKLEGGGRMAKQHRERTAFGEGKFMDDTVYGKLPPVPGRIDS